ncbi:MAG TPA: lipopolysaccharide biosynthesis protein [Solirubrobacteraceae bacterium]|jgi:O-antigen/teichoic acid export membrane protein|nr:lipopolysaccharide biosynthesis protein [Solirubrobacteraceae bacterium]
MRSLFTRLLSGTAAYQASSIASALLAVVTLPLYTNALTTSDYGVAETLLTFIILASILLRFGLGEAFVRYYLMHDEGDERERLAATTTAAVLITTTLASAVGVLIAGPLSHLILGFHDAGIMRIGILGMWAFTNLEIAYGLLRVDERRRAYLTTSLANVVLTVALTVTFVVVLHWGARGYLAGNYIGSTAVLLGLWWTQRATIRPRRGSGASGFTSLKPLLRFGVPTVPADATVFALNVVDRAYLLRSQSAAAAGLFALSVKLATAVILAVRGFQLAWPPLAYSIEDDEHARGFYAAVTTWFVVVTGLVVAGLTLLGRWVVRLLAAPEYYGAHAALPWVALGWAMYGLLLVLVTIGGRAGVTARNFPAALVGVIVNVTVLLLLVPRLGIAGAGIALVAAYAVMLVVLYLLTRRLFVVPFEWGRLTHAVVLVGGIAVGGELLLPTAGFDGFALRTLALAAIPLALLATRFMRPDERAGLLGLLKRGR